MSSPTIYQTVTENATRLANRVLSSVDSAAKGVEDFSRNDFFSAFNMSGAGGPSTSGKPINGVTKLRWTLADISTYINEIPTIQLVEYKNEESLIKKQLSFYSRVVSNTTVNLQSIFNNKLSSTVSTAKDVYEVIWPTTKPTNYIYTLPYYNPISFSLQTQEWKSLEPLGDQLKEFARKIPVVGNFAANVMDLVESTTKLAMSTKFSNVGVVDRPRLFGAHNNRTIDISFPLYNTVRSEDWKVHRDFIQNIMSQNLFYKKDYITGSPPVFYQVYIPGQYFCYAACMTNFEVKNLGNIRKEQGEIVPDAYQIDMTLSEMVMPSKNQFIQGIKLNSNDIVSSTVAAITNLGTNSR